MLGRGTYREVVSALNLDTGDEFAVKVVRNASLMSDNHTLLQREIETLAGVSYVSTGKPLKSNVS